jgi:hypothetical protein
MDQLPCLLPKMGPGNAVPLGFPVAWELNFSKPYSGPLPG